MAECGSPKRAIGGMLACSMAEASRRGASGLCVESDHAAGAVPFKSVVNMWQLSRRRQAGVEFMIQTINRGIAKLIRRHLLARCAWCGVSAERSPCETCRSDMLV
jgi:hypothetical protein